jgi:hypothetical protein
VSFSFTNKEYWNKLNIVLKPNLPEQKVWVSRSWVDCNFLIPPNMSISNKSIGKVVIGHHIPKRRLKRLYQPASKLLQTYIGTIDLNENIIPSRYWENNRNYSYFRLLGCFSNLSKAITIYLVPKED